MYIFVAILLLEIIIYKRNFQEKSMKKGHNKILKLIKNMNTAKKIKIRLRKTSADLYTIYLDFWHNNTRQYQYFKKYIKGTKESYQNDYEIIRYIQSFRDQKEIELLKQKTGFELISNKSKANFVEYIKALVDKKVGNTHSVWLNSYKHLKRFTNGYIQIIDINENFLDSFKEYLLNNVSSSSASTYFARIKTALNLLVRNKVINTNPAINITIKINNKKREFLTIPEIKKIKNTQVDNIQTRNAFLFSCFTGLRVSDIKKLDFKQILEGYLYFQQTKTGQPERIKLHPYAKEIIKDQKKNHKIKDGKIFDLCAETTMNTQIRKWIKDAGIDKHLSFHCARHTYATMCLTSDIDLYTVSKLLGHKKITTTQIYARLIDKKKDEAIDKLPSF